MINSNTTVPTASHTGHDHTSGRGHGRGHGQGHDRSVGRRGVGRIIATAAITALVSLSVGGVSPAVAKPPSPADIARCEAETAAYNASWANGWAAANGRPASEAPPPPTPYQCGPVPDDPTPVEVPDAPEAPEIAIPELPERDTTPPLTIEPGKPGGGIQPPTETDNGPITNRGNNPRIGQPNNETDGSETKDNPLSNLLPRTKIEPKSDPADAGHYCSSVADYPHASHTNAFQIHIRSRHWCDQQSVIEVIGADIKRSSWRGWLDVENIGTTSLPAKFVNPSKSKQGRYTAVASCKGDSWYKWRADFTTVATINGKLYSGYASSQTQDEIQCKGN